ncbi:MAG: DUF2177 family protein [Pseudomonadota bacterium]
MALSTIFILYAVTLVVFLGIDAVWLKTVMKPLFDRHIGDLMAEDLRFGIAAGFYAFYVMGILYFASIPALRDGGWQLAALNGAILGFLAYGTYEATSFSIMRGWTWSMLITDVAWGMFLTALSAVAGVLVIQLLR